MKLIRALAVTVLCGMLSGTAATAAPTGRVWYEEGVGAATVGYDTRTKSTIERKFYLAVHGPAQLGDKWHETARSCSRAAGELVGKRLREELASVDRVSPADGLADLLKELEKTLPSLVSALIAPPIGDLRGAAKVVDQAGKARLVPWSSLAFNTEAVNHTVAEQTGKLTADNKARAEALKRYERTGKAVEAAIDGVKASLAKCGGQGFPVAQFSAAVVLRICTASSCKNKAPSPAGSYSAKGFEALMGWVNSRNVTGRPFPVNGLVGLSKTKGDLKPEQFLEALESNTWPAAPSAEAAQAEFEAGVGYMRKAKQRYSTSAARSIGLARDVGFRVMDVLGSPAEAVGWLDPRPGATLKTISDELARTRLKECVRYQGLSQAEAVSNCAGYKVDDALLKACLRGDKCVPAVGAKALGGVLTIREPADLKKLAQDSLMPRMQSLGGFGELARTYDRCGKSSGGSKDQAMTCVMHAKLGAQDKRTFDCFAEKGATVGALECATGKRLTGDAATLLDCQRRFPNDTAKSGWCAVTGKLPKEARAYVACSERTKDPDALARCIVDSAGGDVGKAAACIRQGGGQWEKSAACIFADKLPQEGQAVIGCLQSSQGDKAALAGCVAGKSLPPEWGKVTQCAAESGGDPVGGGICMVSDGMNAESRIALQCAASSGGNPLGFAGCAGGRLAMKELVQCQGKKFGEDPCFGKNNEFRRLSQNLLGSDISSESVVGQVINKQLDFVKFNVAVAEAGVKGATELANGVGRAAEQGLKETGKVVEGVAQGAAQAAGGTIQFVGGAVGGAAGAAGGAVGGAAAAVGGAVGSIGGAISNCCRF